MAKVKLTEGMLDRLFKNVEKRVEKLKQKNVDKLRKDPKARKALVDFVKSLDSIEDRLKQYDL